MWEQETDRQQRRRISKNQAAPREIHFVENETAEELERRAGARAVEEGATRAEVRISIESRRVGQEQKMKRKNAKKTEADSHQIQIVKELVNILNPKTRVKDYIAWWKFGLVLYHIHDADETLL